MINMKYFNVKCRAYKLKNGLRNYREEILNVINDL